MAVLVTGGAGYIGSVVTERLLAAGEETIVLDDLSAGHREAVAPGAVFVEGRIEPGTLAEVFEQYGVDTVMHLAASIEVGESVTDPLRYFENNVVATEVLLAAMRDHRIPRLVLSSTAAVYGNPAISPISEDLVPAPQNPYGLSKWIAEEMAAWCGKAHGLRYVALRYFNAAGASERYGEDHDPESHLVPRVLRAALGRGEGVTVYGTDYPTEDGTCVRDYVHVEDLAEGHVAAMAHVRAGKDPEVLNLGTGRGHSVLEVIETAQRVTGERLAVRHEGRRPGDAAELVASADKAERVLGWRARKGGLETIVEDAWRWMKRYPGGYGSG